MGAWGYKPFENDGALDWLGDLGDRIAKGTRSRDEQVARAAAALLVTLDGVVFVDRKVILGAIERLERIAADDRFLTQWESKTKYLVALGDQIAELHAVLRRFDTRERAMRAQLAERLGGTRR